MKTTLHSHSHHGAFSRFFPVPKFLEMPHVGVDISEGSLRAIQFIHTNGGLRVEKYFEQILPENTVVNGECINPAPVVEALKSVRRMFQADMVTVSLPDEKSYLFRTDVAYVPGSNVREAIEFTLEENVPIAPADALFEYEAIPEFSANSNDLALVVSVVPRDIISSYAALLSEAALVPLSFKTRSQAIASALFPADEQRTLLVVSVSHIETTLFVVEQGIVQFASVVAVGGANLTSALMRTFSISEIEARQMKKEKSFSKQNSEFFGALLNTISVLKDEMHKIIEYWEGRGKAGEENARKKIDSIVLSGKNSALIGFAEHIADEMRKKVELGNVWQNVAPSERVTPPIPLYEALSFAAAIGLALPITHTKHA